MLEIFFDYRWIRIKHKHSRAVRFLRYQPIDMLKCFDKLPSSFTPDQRRGIRTRLKAERSKARHLFRVRDRNNKLRWAASWAYPVSSVASRMHELRSSPGTTPQDNYWHGIYSWMSWVVHATPQSVNQVVSPSGALRPRSKSLSDPSMPPFVAFVLLLSTIDLLANDLQLSAVLEPEVSRLKRKMKYPSQVP